MKIYKNRDLEGSGRVLAPKRVLGGVWGGCGAILYAKMAQLGPRDGPRFHPGAQITQNSLAPSIGRIKKQKIVFSIFFNGPAKYSALQQRWMEKACLETVSCCFMGIDDPASSFPFYFE